MHGDATAELLRKIQPDVIIHTASLQAWWVVNELPAGLPARVAEAGLGPWLPMHLTLTHRRMQAVRAAGLSPLVVSAPFPDVVNPVLAAVGLAPRVGLGNMDELVPMVEREVARRLGLEVTIEPCETIPVTRRAVSRIWHSNTPASTVQLLTPGFTYQESPARSVYTA